jgi:hypothetical protein
MRRRTTMATGKTREVSAATAEVSTATVAAATVLPHGGMRRNSEGSHNQGKSSKPERQAKPCVALHFPTLSANRGGRQRFYNIRRGSATLRCNKRLGP